MKKLFSITLFFWACTCTQQAQHIPSESGMNNETTWSENLLASGQKIDLLTQDDFHPLEIEVRNE